MTNLDIGDLISYPDPLDMNFLFAMGVVEFAGGVLILIGFWTHLAWIPTLNGGEMAALCWAAFLVLFTFGAGTYSADT